MARKDREVARVATQRYWRSAEKMPSGPAAEFRKAVNRLLRPAALAQLSEAELRMVLDDYKRLLDAFKKLGAERPRENGSEPPALDGVAAEPSPTVEARSARRPRGSRGTHG